MKHIPMFHLIYLPAETYGRLKDEVVTILKTDRPDDVTLQLHAAPGSVALALDAEDEHEAALEMVELGF